jgi:hypothetical protein
MRKAASAAWVRDVSGNLQKVQSGDPLRIPAAALANGEVRQPIIVRSMPGEDYCAFRRGFGPHYGGVIDDAVDGW